MLLTLQLVNYSGLIVGIILGSNLALGLVTSCYAKEQLGTCVGERLCNLMTQYYYQARI